MINFLLQKWSEFFQEVDADIITGYNIINFDLPYLLDRAKHLKVIKFPFLGRIQNELTTMKDSTFESRAYGKRVNKVISIEGRVQFDLLPVSSSIMLQFTSVHIHLYVQCVYIHNTV